MSYVGRFAPTPSGPLHLGSLTTAVASYLHARQHRGRWLVRIEDTDPQRTVPGAADEILRTLDALALHWDGQVIYQSERAAAYREVAGHLLATRAAFRCDCSRRMLRGRVADPELGPRYPGTCRDRQLSGAESAIRVRVESPPITFIDGLHGRTTVDLAALVGDYVIVRRDAVAAYHLAVVVDDRSQQITTVVRGNDLLRATAVHLHLGGLLGYRRPDYLHVPILRHRDGEKISKQSGAARVDLRDPSALAAQVMTLLGCSPPADARLAPPELWRWAETHWSCDALRGCPSITLDLPPEPQSG